MGYSYFGVQSSKINQLNGAVNLSGNFHEEKLVATLEKELDGEEDTLICCILVFVFL